MGAGSSTVSLSMSPTAAPLVQHVATALSRSPPRSAAAVQAAVRAALQTAPLPLMKAFCADCGTDTRGVLERGDLVDVVLPLLVDLASNTTAGSAPQAARRQQGQRQQGAAPASSAATARRSAAASNRQTPRRSHPQPPVDCAIGQRCQLCGDSIRGGDSAMRITIPADQQHSSLGGGSTPRQHHRPAPQTRDAICHSACVRCSQYGCPTIASNASGQQQQFDLRFGKDGRVRTQAAANFDCNVFQSKTVVKSARSIDICSIRPLLAFPGMFLIDCLRSQVYCTAHHDLRFAPKCHQCELPISGPFLTAMQGQKYHTACFVCAGCRQPLASTAPGNGRRHAVSVSPSFLLCLYSVFTHYYCCSIILDFYTCSLHYSGGTSRCGELRDWRGRPTILPEGFQAVVCPALRHLCHADDDVGRD